MGSTAEQTGSSPQQQLFAQTSIYLLDHLRSVFESCEASLLEAGEQTMLCCDLRRIRRTFIDNYLNQLWLRCENPAREWMIGGASSAGHSRTLIYLTQADRIVRELYQEQAVSVGRLAAVWIQQTGLACTVFDCPFSPHTLTRLFFLSLPDLPMPLRIRYKLATVFVAMLPRFSQALQQAIFNVLQRRGVLVASLVPAALPEWWEPLEKAKQPSVAALALVVPPRSAERVAELAHEVATAALAGDQAKVQSLLGSQRQTSLLPWLSQQIGNESNQMPPVARQILSLLSGPLLLASCEEAFSDSAHPARRVIDEWRLWAPGWQECLGIEGVVPEHCRELSTALSELLLRKPETQMSGWQELLDYLLELRKRLQQDISAVVSSTRLSLQVVEVRVEVDALLAERAALEHWPQVIIDIIYHHWSALLLDIHWRDGTASDAWLRAIAVVDELLASVQPGIDQQTRKNLMQRITPLLQGLRKGFESIGCERRTVGILLDRLEQVHLALLRGKDADQLPEPSELWPEVAKAPMQDEPFEVGSWLQRDDGSVLSVEFSDAWCTALRDAHNATLECCATAALQADFCEGNLVILPSSASLLPVLA
ncbi:MAG TPA: DUF1631 family protein [Pseudomonadales bacterium]|nr:DUF1631 family protein [Pseudomonadales bacterium]